MWPEVAETHHNLRTEKLWIVDGNLSA